MYDPVTWLCVYVPAAVGLAEANLWAACDALSNTVMQQVPRLVCFFWGGAEQFSMRKSASSVQFSLKVGFGGGSGTDSRWRFNGPEVINTNILMLKLILVVLLLLLLQYDYHHSY